MSNRYYSPFGHKFTSLDGSCCEDSDCEAHRFPFKQFSFGDRYPSSDKHQTSFDIPYPSLDDVSFPNFDKHDDFDDVPSFDSPKEGRRSFGSERMNALRKRLFD